MEPSQGTWWVSILQWVKGREWGKERGRGRVPEEEGERERVVKKNRTQKTVIFVSINPAPVSHIFYPLETTCSFCLSAGVTAPRRSVCMSAAKVQLECTTIDTSEPQIQKHVHIMEHMVITTINLSGHHTYSHARAAVPHRSPYLHVDTSAHTHTQTKTETTSQMLTAHTFTRGHLCLCLFPLLSTWLCCAPHCAPSMSAIWNQTPMVQHLAEVIHLLFFFLESLTMLSFVQLRLAPSDESSSVLP